MEDNTMESNTSVYSVRHTAKKEVINISLEDNSVTLQSDRGKHTVINYDQISAINISPFDENSYSCTVTSKSNTKIKFLSRTFVGIANFEDKGSEFKNIIAELQIKTTPYHSQIAFSQGSSLLFFITLIALTLSLGCLGFLMSGGMGGQKDISYFAFLIGCFVIIFKSIIFLSKGRSKKYHPENGELPFN